MTTRKPTSSPCAPHMYTYSFLRSILSFPTLHLVPGTDHPQSSHPTVRETLEASQSRIASHLTQPPSDAPAVSQATEKVDETVTKGSSSAIEGGKAVEAPVGDGRKVKE